MTKLEEFLIWKQKEFVEKYNDRWFDNQDNFTLMNGEDQEGLPAVALFNQSLLEWDGRMAYPWMTAIEVNFGPGNNGMPDTKTFTRIRLLEEELGTRLNPAAGCLNLGVETYKGIRTIYFACREFRESSKAVRRAIEKFAGTLTIDYSVYKDKYWRTMDKYRQNQ